jgi:hypothetical protein
MIARHSHEQTDSGEGVEVVENVTCEDPEHGKGQYTEKRIHLSRYCMSVRFQVLTAASMMFRVVFWDILPCKMIVDSSLMMEAVRTS